MIFIALVLTVILVSALIFAARRITHKYPASEPIVRYLGNALYIVAIASVVYTGIWLHQHPQPAGEPVALPKYIHPPELDHKLWTTYAINRKENFSFATALPVEKVDDNIVQVWERYDDFSNSSIRLSLTRYDCEYGIERDLYDVSYVDNKYSGYVEYDKNDPDANEKIDLETVGGSGFLLACYGRMPSDVNQGD